MIRILYRTALCCIVAGVNVTVSAQKLDSIMNIYHENFPQEKIHVHFDKRYYNPGETIWFKGYIMSGAGLSDISKNFYAELINEKGMVLQRTISPVINASAASSFTIPANYASQTIHFRAYTTWMLNFDTIFLYNKNIPILTAAATATAASIPNTTSIQFFPEGGDLVADLESVVAFKANDRYGLPVKANGYVKSSNGKKLTDFTSGHDGMGVFTLTPVKGETYTAVWKDATNKENTTLLPAPATTGLVLHALTAPGSVTFAVKRSEEGSDMLKQVYLIAHMDQQMVYKARISLSEKMMSSGRIPVDQLPSGILQLTAFNADWQPLAERIVFVNNNDYIFDTYLQTASKSLSKRGKNVLEIEIPDTTFSNLSLAVTDAALNAPEENEDNIFSRLLLTGEIRGYVHNPGYYFSSFADSVARQLDVVLLTHGWRRFNWDNVGRGKLPDIRFLPDNYLTLKGSLLGVSPAKLSADNQLNLIMQFKDSTSQFLSVPIQQGGKFVTAAMLFYDTASIFYQLNNRKQQSDNLILTVDNGLWKGPALVTFPADVQDAMSRPAASIIAKNKALYEAVKMNADRMRRVQTLQEVTVKARSKTAVDKMEDTYTSGLFRGGDGYSFDLSTDVSATSAMTVFNYLQGKVAGLTISNALSSEPSLSWRGGTPDLYLNEMRSDAQGISGISMADIAFIKVFRPPFMGGMGGGGGGAIAIYTKKGGPSGNTNFKGLNKVVVNGYTPVKQFYSPDYTQSNPLHEAEDLRTTLYWEPYIFLHKDKKKATIIFYNNDISKKLRVVIEGVNDAGKLTRVESVIE